MKLRMPSLISFPPLLGENVGMKGLSLVALRSGIALT